jgi:hypothetical protein
MSPKSVQWFWDNDMQPKARRVNATRFRPKAGKAKRFTGVRRRG